MQDVLAALAFVSFVQNRFCTHLTKAYAAELSLVCYISYLMAFCIPPCNAIIRICKYSGIYG